MKFTHLRFLIILMAFMTACSTTSTQVGEASQSTLSVTDTVTASVTLTPSVTHTFENIHTLRAVIQSTRQVERTRTQAVRELTTTPTLTPSPLTNITPENMATFRAVIQTTRQVQATGTQAIRNLTATLLAQTPSVTPTITPRPTRAPASTPAPTIDLTQQTWQATAISLRKTENAVWDEERNAKATQVAQFPIPCDDMNTSILTPDGEWLATSCGYKRDRMLVVQNRDGTRWELLFQDFLSPDRDDRIMGTLEPITWSPDGKHLYFTKILGYSGGGNQCFPGFGTYGLFRLNLASGSWITLIPPRDNFPGDKIRFSPNGNHYAVDNDGIKIVETKTGSVSKINSSGVMEMSWSPDGKFLAYSVASCGEYLVESSSVYVWDTLTAQAQILYTNEEMLLRPQSWSDNSRLIIEGEKFVDLDTFYTIYEYDIEQGSIVFEGTATPYP